ncbi:tetratricopeptide repeat protein [Roseibium algae]|uniref:Tetratricopeptide repeat protein n=1 Tax=Roseibium algae TaxID=3123038 RepID=A0ABU8TPE8_9HYPH
MSAVRKFILVSGLVASISSGALAFDGTPTQNQTIGPSDVSPTEALRHGARQYYSGDKVGALTSLQYAAEKGQPMAAWKLGKMYASGDGVPEDDQKAFQYYSQVVRQHGNDRSDSPDAPFVASAFVALGNYYRKGITDMVPQNMARATQIFTHAASFFGDPEAQYELGRIYQPSSGRMAVRWYNLAAIKGHVGAQARLGETLFNTGRSESRKARGLMWMSVALEQSKSDPNAGWIRDLHEQYFAHASESIRRSAGAMADTWMAQNRPDLIETTTTTASAPQIAQ